MSSSQKLRSNPFLSTKPFKSLTPAVRGLLFVIVMWFLSRFAIIVAMQVIAPLIPSTPSEPPVPVPLGFIFNFVPKPSWELFTHWDAAWFRQIVLEGYNYAPDGKMHNVAFFPLFPLTIRAVMTFGFPFEISAVLVNNFALLGALILLYRWVEESHGASAARWATAVMAWCPFSLFGTVIYSEGLFLLFSTAALRAFEKHQYARAAVWGAMTTATRVTGMALVPTFFLVAWRERRPAIAYIVGLLTCVGLLSFCLYCAIRFGEPLAFVRVQKAWGTSTGFNWGYWYSVVYNLFQWRIGAIRELTKLVMVLGGGYLLWYFRNELTRVCAVYGLVSIALIVNSGATLSVNRYVYGIVSASVAMGLLLSRNRRWGYATMGLFAVSLVGFAIHFAWWRFVA